MILRQRNGQLLARFVVDLLFPRRITQSHPDRAVNLPCMTIGLIARPESSTATYFTTLNLPVSGNTPNDPIRQAHQNEEFP
jgi:hypothetical protein